MSGRHLSNISTRQLNNVFRNISKKKFVLLAEQSHITQELSEVRIDIIKMCHQFGNFNFVAFELSPINMWTMMNKLLTGETNEKKLTKIGFDKIWQTDIISSLVKYAIDTDLYIMSYDVVQTMWQTDFVEFFKECNKLVKCDFDKYVNIFNQIRALNYNQKPTTDFLNLEFYSKTAITHNKGNYRKLKQLEKRYFKMLDELKTYLQEVSKLISNKYHSFVLENITNMLRIDWDNWTERQYIINNIDATELDTWYFNMRNRDRQGCKYLIKLYNKFGKSIFAWNHLVHSYYSTLYNDRSVQPYKRSYLKPLGYWFKKNHQNNNTYVLAFLHGKGNRKQTMVDRQTWYVPEISPKTGEKEYNYELAAKYKDITFIPKSKLKRIPMLVDNTWVIPYKDFDGVVFVPRISLPKII